MPERRTLSSRRVQECFTAKGLPFQIGHPPEWRPLPLAEELAGTAAGTVDVPGNGPGLVDGDLLSGSAPRTTGRALVAGYGTRW